MRIAMRRDFVYVTFGSALPAMSNFVAVVFALKYLDAVWLGRSYALLALFFVSIDVFNFGSARLYSVAKIRERFHSLLFLDALSAIGSTLFFCIAAAILSRSGAIALPRLLPILGIAPFGYAMSHFALGYLRLNRGNGVICAVSTISALSRCGVIWLVTTIDSWLPFLPDLLLVVESSYGAMLLVTYLVLRRPSAKKSDSLVRLATYLQLATLGGKELLSSWYANAIFSGAKHADVIVAAMLLGPAGAALYRGAKSVHNLAFNLGQALALVYHERLYAWAVKSKKHFSLLRALLLALVGAALLMLATAAAYKLRLFPTVSLGAISIQYLFLLLIFAGASLMFACRFTSITIFLISQRSFVILSTAEVVGSLSLLSCLCVAFGVVGAALSVAISCAGILVSSSIVVARWTARSARVETARSGVC
jgi:hypothetical protein